MTKSAGNCGSGRITEEILNGKLRFLCSVGRRNDIHIHSATPIDDQDLIDFLSLYNAILFKNLFKKVKI